MAANLEIEHGNPPWLSPSIVPSRDVLITTISPPATSLVRINSTNVSVYVKVKNIGTVAFGTPCATTGAWSEIILFQGRIDSTSVSTSYSQFSTTFSITPKPQREDSISGVGFKYDFGIVASELRAWAWSPDGKFFAYVSSYNRTNWNLKIIALQNITLSNGATIIKGNLAAESNGMFEAWDNINFGWAGSSAVVSNGKSVSGNMLLRAVTCPLSVSSNKTYPNDVQDEPNVGWVFVFSPCGSVVAFLPQIKQSTHADMNLIFISTVTASATNIKKNNAPIFVQMDGPSPSIETIKHEANGVKINPGNGSPIFVDDPDCTFIGGGIKVVVDRVKASTLLSGNLGVLNVGSAYLGQLGVGDAIWVQVPNSNPSGWGNQSEKHWCLLAQAYTTDLITIPRPWDGQSNSPFPTLKTNCAQRNIEILP